MKKKEPCHMCGMVEGHTHQCSMPVVHEYDVSEEDLKKVREFREKKYQIIPGRKDNAS